MTLKIINNFVAIPLFDLKRNYVIKTLFVCDAFRKVQSAIS